MFWVLNMRLIVGCRIYDLLSTIWAASKIVLVISGIFIRSHVRHGQMPVRVPRKLLSRSFSFRWFFYWYHEFCESGLLLKHFWNILSNSFGMIDNAMVFPRFWQHYYFWEFPGVGNMIRNDEVIRVVNLISLLLFFQYHNYWNLVRNSSVPGFFCSWI